MTKTETHTNKTILRVLLAAAAVLILCGAAVGAVGACPTGGTSDNPAEISGTQTGGNISGYYKLTGNVTLETENLTVTGDCTIDLNGWVLNGNYAIERVIIVYSGTLMVTDTVNSSAPPHYFENDSGLYKYKGDSQTGDLIEIKGGCTTGGIADDPSVDEGGGVCVGANGTFTIEG